jgi:hypothetical protein
VIENYVRRPAGEKWNTPIKSIVHPPRVANFCLPHFFSYREGHCVDENNHPLPNRHVTDSVSFARLRVNHYMTRSAEEYRTKLSRPTADLGRSRELTDRQFERRLKVLDEVEDRSIQIYLPDLRKALADLDLARSSAAPSGDGR